MARKKYTAEFKREAVRRAGVTKSEVARELLRHSDQGSQYTAEDFQRRLTGHGIVCGMSRRGDRWDNAALERFFPTLKMERVNRSRYHTRDAARADSFDYIERFYNPRRRHSTLGQISLGEFEKDVTFCFLFPQAPRCREHESHGSLIYLNSMVVRSFKIQFRVIRCRQ